MDWFSARDACRNLGGRLVSLETQHEYSVVAAFTAGGQRPLDIRSANVNDYHLRFPHLFYASYNIEKTFP